MYPGIACNRDIPVSKTKILHFKEFEDGSVPPALVAPAVNISETESEYIISIAAAGLQRADFKIEIEKLVITIAAKNEVNPVIMTKDRCEYDYTNWTRAFALPPDADSLLTHASYHEGELVIHVPRGNTSDNSAKATVYVY